MLTNPNPELTTEELKSLNELTLSVPKAKLLGGEHDHSSVRKPLALNHRAKARGVNRVARANQRRAGGRFTKENQPEVTEHADMPLLPDSPTLQEIVNARPKLL